MFKVLGHADDIKTNAKVIYCQTTPQKYLEIIGSNFKDFELQRKKENHKAYNRLKADIIEGTLLPSITLAVKHEHVEEILAKLEDSKALVEKLASTEGIVDILDGLQRTYILSELKENNVQFKEGQTLLLEYWLESDLQNIIYRMIVLNSGQKAMSMRHQIDLLFATTRKTIQDRISGVELFTEKEGKKRTTPNKYPLSHIAGAYYAFLKGTPEQDGENIVNHQISNEISESSKEKLNSDFEMFLNIFKYFNEIDQLSWDLYQRIDEEKIRLDRDEIENIFPSDGYNWFGSDNVLLGFFAAAGQLIENGMIDKLFRALEKMKVDIQKINSEKSLEDYFDIYKYELLLKKINAKKVNIGSERRKYILQMFKDHLKNEADFKCSVSWNMASF